MLLRIQDACTGTGVCVCSSVAKTALATGIRRAFLQANPVTK
jgi:hypothetical protein